MAPGCASHSKKGLNRRVLAGTARSLPLRTPDGPDTRPTTDRIKETLFNIIAFDLPECSFLDLFAGSGGIGIEALSRGASEAVFVDAADAPCKLIKENLRRTKMESEGRVVRSDYLQFLTNCKETFDIIFLDPPYAEVFLENAIKKISEIDILQSGGIIVCERPVEKALNVEIEGYSRSKDYKYGNTIITLYRKIRE